MKEYGKKESTFFQIKGYPGLERMAEFIIPLIPKSKVYIEPFAGLGRTVEIDKHEKVILNDLSDYSINYLKETFPSAEIIQGDFRDIIRKYRDNSDVFMLIDPPWRKNIYKNNNGPIMNFDKPKSYYLHIFSLLRDRPCKWIVCCDRDEHEIGTIVSKSGYINKVIQHPAKKLYGKSFAVRLCSNMW